MLVFGETLALLSALSGAILRFAGVDVPWLFISAAVASTLFLAWYAVDLVSRGERPLTPRFVNTVRSIASVAYGAKRQSLSIDWENPIEHEDGSISFLVDKAKTLELLGEQAPQELLDVLKGSGSFGIGITLPPLNRE